MGNLLNSKKDRDFSLDFIRFFAVLAVVMIHISAEFVVSYPSHSLEFFVGNIFDALSRIGVPLFVMISGSLMLKEEKQISLKQIFFKYILNIVIVLVAWSALYAVIWGIIIPYLYQSPISIQDIFKRFIYGHYHMWYLYMIIGLYSVTPHLTIFC